MKTKDIAYGGMMIGIFLVINFAFRTNLRVFQTYLEIIKVIIVAVSIRSIERKNWWIFATGCFVSCMIFVSVPDTLIYNVPSIVGGCVIGLQKNSKNKFIDFMIFFIVNSIMIIYEFILFGVFMKSNLFLFYKEMTASIISEITSCTISGSLLQAFFILFMICDSFFSSIIIFSLTQIVLKKLKWPKDSYHSD